LNRSVLTTYQLAMGISDTATGTLLIVSPGLALRLMGLHVPADALLFLSFIGAFVLSVGLACLYGVWVIARRGSPCKLEVVWLLTAITRASVAIFLVLQILARSLDAGWLTVAITDGSCALIQAMGLRKGCLARVAQ
jgi:hypothetical protein